MLDLPKALARMLKPLSSLALGALLALPAAQALALGFGRVGNTAALGQPLSFSVGVRLDADENLAADCVSAEVFSGDNRLPPSTVRVAIEPGSEPAERTLRVVSNTVIDEPVLTVNLQLACPNRLTRKFVVFVDPPMTLNLAQAPAPAAAPPAAARATQGGEAMAPVAAATAAPAKRSQAVAKAPAKPARREPRKVAVLPATTASPAPQAAAADDPSAAPAKARSPAAKTARAPAKPSGPRLELEAADDAATRERLDLRLTTGLAASPAAAGASAPAAAPDPEAAQRAKERERLLALEESLTKLRAESQATQASLAQMQLRLHDAEAQRYANPLVFALAALVAALAAAVAVLLWRRRDEREAAAHWWAPHADAAADEAGHAAAADALLASRRLPVDEVPLAETTGSPMLLTQAHALLQADAEPDTGPRASAPWQEPAHEMSVEELIDLEQEAEFFVVLGQDEAAIDLLVSHLRSSGGASPLPYLKLLEIYRRRGEREAHERIRERFNRRFNAYAPDWQADPQQGRALLDYPNAVGRLQALWATPAQAMLALEASLFRRDGNNATFDLPAYRELLFLYSVARDLSERDATVANVDLLLPIGDEAQDSQLIRLHPTLTPPALAEHATLVDVDISGLDAGPSERDGRPSRFQTDFSPTSGFMGMPGEWGTKPG